jgi:hypothetical protein
LVVVVTVVVVTVVVVTVVVAWVVQASSLASVPSKQKTSSHS